MRGRQWTVVVWTLAAAGPVLAMEGSELNLNPGIAITTSDTGDVTSNSFSIDGSYIKRMHEVAWIGPELGYLFGADLEGTVNDELVAGFGGTSFTSDIKYRVIHFAPLIKLGPVLDVQGFKLNPFILGGGGYYFTHRTGGTVNITGGPLAGFSANVDSEDFHNGGFNYGAGISLNLPQNWGVGFELRYHRILYKDSPDFTFLTPALRFTLLLQ
jgi:opacity protein-like surface antigen